MLDDVTIDEMLQMREQGMGNQDIADALGTTVATVRKYIGNQPKELYKARGGYHPPKPKKEPEPEPSTAFLVVQNREIELHGLQGKYMVDCKGRSVLVDINIFGEQTFTLSLDDVESIAEKLTGFVGELKAIARKVDELAVKNEMW